MSEKDRTAEEGTVVEELGELGRQLGAALKAAWESEQEKLRRRIMEAKKLLPEVKLGEEMLKLITQICLDFAVDGHRADIVIHKTATTLAAYYGRTEVTEEDVREAAELALLHRRRRQPFEEPELNEQQLEKSIQSWRRNQENKPEDEPEQGENPPAADPPQHNDPPGDGEEPEREQTFEAEPPYKVRPLIAPVRDEISRSETGRRSKSRTDSKTCLLYTSPSPRD